jgi:tetratricopeptide (TPR) repeat protein
MDLRRLKQMAAILVLPLIVMSCSGTQGRLFSSSAEKATPPAKDVSQPPPPKWARTDAIAQNHMAAEEYQKAIDVYDAGYRKQPQDTMLVKAYVQSIETMASNADRAFRRQLYASAGKTYDILLKNNDRFKAFEKDLSFDAAGLNKKLETCKKALFKQGLQEYRKGHLDQSIAVWENLLLIDPQNAAIEEALRTARLQKKNLEEVQ